MKFYYYGILLIFFTSCLETDFAPTGINTSSDVSYLDSGYPKGNIPGDPFRIIYVSPISSSRLSVVAEFGGGCTDHYFFTWWGGSLTGTETKSTSLYLYHDGQDDECDAIVRDTITIELSQAMPGQSNFDFNINVVNESISQSILIDRNIYKYVDEMDCDVPVRLKRTICGEGIWDDRWFRLGTEYDSTTYYWFQPVKEISGLTPLDTGDYKIGVSLLFGYSYTNTNANCLTLPEGRYFPAVINCVEGN